jgi:RNA polymerase sigma factor (sigma-70 family)
MILNRGPPSGFETSNKISNSGGTDMYIEHPYFYEGKYYANIDGEMIEVTKEVAYAMNNFYRSSKAKKVELKNELGEVVDKMLREVPYSGQSIDGEGFMIEDFPDLNCDVEHCVLTKMEQQDIHKVINQLNSEERMIIYGIFFENKTQTQMAEIMGISRQMLSYKLKSTLNKMREMYMNKFF